MEDNIPGFDWKIGCSGAVLDDEQTVVLTRLFGKYLNDKSETFAERLDWLEKHGIDDDQLYITEDVSKL